MYAKRLLTARSALPALPSGNRPKKVPAAVETDAKVFLLACSVHRAASLCKKEFTLRSPRPPLRSLREKYSSPLEWASQHKDDGCSAHFEKTEGLLIFKIII